MPQRQDNRFVWNDEHPEAIAVRAVEVLDGFSVRLEFSDGSVRELDLEPYLRGPVFEPLRHNREMFRRMRVEGGTLVWENGTDIAPEALYEDSRPVPVPAKFKA